MRTRRSAGGPSPRRSHAAGQAAPHHRSAACRRCARPRRQCVACGRSYGRKARPALARRRSLRRSDWPTALALRRVTTAMPATGAAPAASGVGRTTRQASPTVAPATGRHASVLNGFLLVGGFRSVHAGGPVGAGKAVITLTFPMAWRQNRGLLRAASHRRPIKIAYCASQYIILQCTKTCAIF